MEVANNFCGESFASERNKRRGSASHVRCVVIFAAILVLSPQIAVQALVASAWQQNSANQDKSTLSEPESELQVGTALTRKGLFREAIPHLLAARGQVSNEYAANFNLALCYVGTSQFNNAIQILNSLHSAGHEGADVENLLAQAYIGNSQPQEALASLQKAAALSPQNEHLYSFVADACADHQDYSLGLKIVGIGLRNLSQSARLHYQRAIFLTQLDEFDQAKQDFELAAKLAPGTEIAYLATSHEQLLDGDITAAIRSAQEGVKKGYENHALLTVLGEALIRSGVSPGQSEFAEAQTALEKAVAEQPNDASAQIALGTLYSMAGRLDDAIAHLEKARQLDPGNPSVYANLARAYQRHGDAQQSQDALAVLQKLNQDQAYQISATPGDRKLGYASRGVSEEEVIPQQ
jgi:tetratricopeptide (TPR) repeat protein